MSEDNQFCNCSKDCMERCKDVLEKECPECAEKINECFQKSCCKDKE